MSSHVLTYLCKNMHEVRTLHLDRLRTLRDEGFEVQICAGRDDSFDALQSEGFVLCSLPVIAGLHHNLAAWLICWAHLVENPPTLLHGFDSWAWTAALASERLPISATCVTIRHHHTIPALPEFLSRRFELPSALDPIQAYSWLGARVDKYLVQSEADLDALQSVVPGEKLDLILGGDGVVLPSEVVSATETIVAVDASEASKADLKSLRDIHRLVRRRVPQAKWRVLNSRAIPIPDAEFVESHESLFSGASLFLDFESARDTSMNLMSAAGFGLPCVSVLKPASVQVIATGRTGLVTEANVESIAGGLIDLLDHPKLLAEMSAHALGRAQSRFSRHGVDDQIIRVYERTLRTRMGL